MEELEKLNKYAISVMLSEAIHRQDLFIKSLAKKYKSDYIKIIEMAANAQNN